MTLLLFPSSFFGQTFTATDLPIPVASSGMAHWGDYDGDGDYDFVITGQPELRVYRNDGGDAFTSQGLLVALSQSPGAVWGDWDNDNDLDLVVGGADTGGVPVLGEYSLTRLYRNDGASGFTLVGEGIPFAGLPTLTDFDNDGDLDLMIARGPTMMPGGQSDINSVRFYSNEGNGNFKLQFELPMPNNTIAVRAMDLNGDGWTDLAQFKLLDGEMLFTARLNLGNCQFTSNSWVLSPLGPGFPLFGDLDNDGDEDFGVLAYGNGPLPSYSGWLRNDGSTNTLLPGIEFPLANLTCSLADYDNDGRLDVAATGGTSGYDNVFQLFHNNGGFSFTTNTPNIEGTQYAVMAWGDADGDGDLDLLLSGIPNPPYPGNPFIRLYRNDTPVTNAQPQTPTNLIATVSGSSVQLSWAAVTDANQSGGLSYNVRVGRAGQGVDVITPAANLVTGKLLLPQVGNAGHGLFRVLTNLLAGTYYWSVQAVDNAFAASAFAVEGSFEIAPGLPRVGEPAASDLRFPHATLTASAIPNGAPASVWFEYGLSTNYDQATPATAIGSGIAPVAFTNEITSLLTATQYHFRAVASNVVGIAYSSDKTLFISNTPPTISNLTNLVVLTPNQTSPGLSFNVGDLESPADLLQVTGTAQNATLLPPSGIAFGGAGSNRTVQLTPAPEQRGITTVTVRVTDEHGGQSSSGLTLRVEDFSPVWSLLTGSSELAVGDINRDGFLDFVRNDRWLQNLSGTNWAQPSGGNIQNPIASGTLGLADVDDDGDLDIAESGSIATTRLTWIWTNAPPPVGLPWLRSAAVSNLPGYFSASLTWADFDQDGDMDLVLAGSTNTPNPSNFKTRVCRNDGGLNFTPLADVLPDLADASLAWADFDRDGAMDVCVSGTTNGSSGYLTGVYRNNGAGQFTSVPAGLPGITRGLVRWGDVDNDGWPDLLLCGIIRVGNTMTNLTKLFRNNTDGTFSEYSSFAPLNSPRGFLVDVDNDGRLDVLLVGTMPGDMLATPVARFYLNRGEGQFLDIGPTLPSGNPAPTLVAVGDFDRDGRVDVVLGSRVYLNRFPATNVPPTAPANLSATPNASGVTLAWSAATDANQSGGLTYNLRVGTGPGLGNVLSPLADPATGQRWVRAPGNASQSLQWRLRNLAPGTYFWSVQAIDHAGGESPFAQEATFDIPDLRPVILSVRASNGTVSLKLRFVWAGNYSVLTSTNLSAWSELPPSDYLAGETNIILQTSSETSQFLRLRRN
ncbi:MAG: VCBS repeat-containing protein [Verrucomicrobiae bacterium]|nr:VCBS repeat-containing protein [Verrucomicrobiae bacterium]